ncbi:hypothetical protein D3C76_1263140 [compost metagenome]
MEPLAPVDPIPVLDAVQRIKEGTVGNGLGFTTRRLQMPIAAVEHAHHEWVDQGHRRPDRDVHGAGGRGFERPVFAVIANGNDPTPQGSPLGQAIDPGHAVFMRSIEFCRQGKELAQSTKSHPSRIDPAGSDLAQANVHPTDNTRQAQTTEGGGKPLGIFRRRTHHWRLPGPV